MAARTTTKTKPETPEYDFDAWTEEDEAAALAAIAPKVKYIVVERRFVGRFEDGDIVEVPLSISLNDVDELQDTYASAVDQFKGILRTVGGEEVVETFASHDLAEAAVMSEKYFRVLAKVQAAGLPES